MMNMRFLTVVIALSASVANADRALDHGWTSKAAVDISSIPVVTEIAAIESVETKSVTKKLMSVRMFATSASSLALNLPPDSEGRIAECARGLRYDWQRCFDFVRDNIVFSPCAGILRGPVRTLVDMEGSDVDQALLLMALLKASGYDDIRLMYEPVAVTNGSLESGFMIPFQDEDACNAITWLGLPATDTSEEMKARAASKLSNGGHKVVRYFKNGNLYAIVTDHFWVDVSIDGKIHSLDPSFKPLVSQDVADIATQMKYDREALLDSAGGTVDSVSVKSISANKLSESLDTYANNLSRALTNANWSAADYLGMGAIVPRKKNDPYAGGTYIGSTHIDVFARGTSYVNNLRTSVHVTLDGSLLQSFYLDEIGLRNLWLSYEQNGSALNAVLHLDDEVVKTVATQSSGSATLRIEVDYAHGASAKDYSIGRRAGNVYSIIVGFGSDSRGGIRKFATGELARLRNAGYTNDSRRMLAAMTYSAGHHWMAECAAIERIRNCVLGMDGGKYYDVGISGQDGGPYVDMANRVSFGTHDITHFDGAMFFDSSLEHSVLEQLNGSRTPSLSTVKILSLASASDNPIYYMNSNNASSIIPMLNNYSSATLANFSARTAEQEIILVPKDAHTVLNQWRGTGYVSFGPVAEGVTSVSTGMIISGGYNGGYSSEKGYPDNADYYQYMLPDGTYLLSNTPIDISGDPVAMPYGNFLDRKQDLALNRANALSWNRQYDSSESYSDGSLGRGWSHNFDARILHTTDTDSFFGRGSAQAVIPSVVAAAVVDDLLKDQKTLSAGENARRWTLAALVIKWWADQLCNTAITVKLGSMTLGFTRNPDGTYAPAPGVTAELTKSGEIFTLQERHGNRYVFNADGQLASIVDPSGNTTRLTYSFGKLTKVENDFEAGLTVGWTGERITSVADNAGRSVAYSYDSNGCMTKVVDSNGKSWTATYDAQSHALLTKTNPDGQRTIKNTYNEFRQVTNQVSDIGQTWTFGYASLCEAWDRNPLGKYLWKKYDSSGRIRLLTNRDLTTEEYAYDGHGHKTSTVDAAGHVKSTVYDANDNIASTKEGSGADQREIRFAYDSQKRLQRLTNAMGQSKQFTYDSCHRVTRATDYDGSYIANTWTSAGLLSERKHYTPSGRLRMREVYEYGSYGLPTVKTVYGDGLPSSGYRTTTTYTASGQIATSTDPNGNTTTFTYDKNGKLLSAKDALGRTASRTYTATGYLKSVTDAKGHTTSYTVTVSGNPSTITAADGGVRCNTYNAADELVSVTDARGVTTTLTRDAMGRVTKTTSPIGSVSTGYDILGNPIVVTNAAGVVTKTEYDSLSRPIVTIDGKGSTWRTAYDSLDRVTSTTTPLGKTTRSTYDKLSRKTATVRPSGARDAFGYDDSGALSAYTNAEGAVYRIYHDALGRVTAITNAIGNGLFSAKYDGAGNILSRTDGTGGVLTFGYDACNRLVSKTGTGLNATFGYDNADNMTSAANATASESFTYDVCNRLTGATTTVGGKSFSSSYAYDLGGLITSVTYASGKTVTRTYDAEGRLTSVTDWLGHTWRMTYDADGKLLSLVSPDTTTASRSYDAATGRLVAWNVGEIAGRSITRDAMGRKTSEAITKGKPPTVPPARKSENVHNAADQLTSAKVTKDGNTVNETYTYDGDGALTRATATSADAVIFGYTAERQLASVTCGGTSVSFGYDALGNRVVADGKYWIPDFTDPLKRPLVECASSGAVLRYYIWGGGRLLGFVDSSGALTVAHADDYGSVIALTDASGTAKWRANYGPHGEDCGTDGANPTPFAWLGGFGVQRLGVDSFMGTIYNTRHRLYSVNQHRFLSSDPMGLIGGLNLYAYGNCNAVAYIDPLGLCSNGDFSFMDGLHTALDVAGMFDQSGIADGLNALLYLGEGDFGNAAISAAALVPGVGAGATAARVAKNTSKLVDGAKTLNNGAKTLNKGDNVIDATNAFRRSDNITNDATRVEPGNPVRKVEPVSPGKNDPNRQNPQPGPTPTPTIKPQPQKENPSVEPLFPQTQPQPSPGREWTAKAA